MMNELTQDQVIQEVVERHGGELAYDARPGNRCWRGLTNGIWYRTSLPNSVFATVAKLLDEQSAKDQPLTNAWLGEVGNRSYPRVAFKEEDLKQALTIPDELWAGRNRYVVTRRGGVIDTARDVVLPLEHCGELMIWRNSGLDRFLPYTYRSDDGFELIDPFLNEAFVDEANRARYRQLLGNFLLPKRVKHPRREIVVLEENDAFILDWLTFSLIDATGHYRAFGPSYLSVLRPTPGKRTKKYERWVLEHSLHPRVSDQLFDDVQHWASYNGEDDGDEGFQKGDALSSALFAWVIKGLVATPLT